MGIFTLYNGTKVDSSFKTHQKMWLGKGFYRNINEKNVM